MTIHELLLTNSALYVPFLGHIESFTPNSLGYMNYNSKRNNRQDGKRDKILRSEAVPTRISQ